MSADLTHPSGLKLGQTYSSAFIEKQQLDGIEAHFPDIDPSNLDVNLSGMRTKYRLVKNASGGALTPKIINKWGTVGTTSGGAAAATDVAAGVVDQYLGSTTVANGDYFWLAVEGPHLITSVGATTAAAIAAIGTGGKSDDATSPPTDGDVGIHIEAASGADEDKRVLLMCSR